MGPLHHQVAATMVPLLAARPIASTADFRRFGPPQPLPVNHLLCENCRTQGRIGEVGLMVCTLHASVASNITSMPRPLAFLLNLHRTIRSGEEGCSQMHGLTRDR